MAKLDASLVPVWARRWGGSSGSDRRNGVAVDSNGNVTVVGNFSGTIDVGPGNTVLTSTGTQPTNLNPFIVTLDGATGKTLCAQAYGDAALKGGNATAMAVNRQATGANQDAIAVVGYFPPGIDFGKPTTPLVTPRPCRLAAAGSCCACSLLVGGAPVLTRSPRRASQIHHGVSQAANSPAPFRRAVHAPPEPGRRVQEQLQRKGGRRTAEVLF